jgi:uncharacterized protein YjbJ (UPF0337 family)
MGLLDKLLGRTKQAAGDMAGDRSLRNEGVHQEQKAEAEERAEHHEHMAAEERAEAAEHSAQEHDDHLT